ncbi:GyrI-like domain-containing protein [Streptomyces sp. NPDC007875]|uniref:GyrI-like domain-containing protein n=1 Tax=Streptomyces sp. NPDC007875 TaxID=3364783 RepID=UPI0036CC54DF
MPESGAITSHLAAADTPELVRAPKGTFLSVGGSGRPGTETFYRKMAFVTAVEAALPGALRISPSDACVIEILYWYPKQAESVEIEDFYTGNSIDLLEYRITTRVADSITHNAVVAARRDAAGSADDPGGEVELFTLPESLVVQVMHHGPFKDEFETLARLGAFARERGLRRSGPHREIHIDPFTAQTPQDALRTILRDPVA